MLYRLNGLPAPSLTSVSGQRQRAAAWLLVPRTVARSIVHPRAADALGPVPPVCVSARSRFAPPVTQIQNHDVPYTHTTSRTRRDGDRRGEVRSPKSKRSVGAHRQGEANMQDRISSRLSRLRAWRPLVAQLSWGVGRQCGVALAVSTLLER